MIRVVLVDDDAIVRQGLRAILESAPDVTVVAEASDGAAGVADARGLLPDVVIMDIRMPRMDGLAATRAITALPSRPKVIILTTFGLDEYVAEALRAGAVGFLLKDTGPTELLEALRVVMAGDALLSPAVTRQLIAAFTHQVPSLSRQERARLASLTPRELQVLTLLGRGYSNADIATELFLGEATVKGHVSRILDKLGAGNRVQAAIRAHDAGLTRLARE
ncbi:DNA-binding response regulator [Streptomyces spectabilis]|uniref:DNA-binding NarL/FixJ family response regulator n=1 Tax=Streptomyces spectabilis TaxID=68270 RepID=A0A7W8B3I4_STRST|nr:response regulator transcription factor [Streptomyces spectabilis]MBB5109689.1 DNA-binding NarL/FixJ family response regulator [Streptomyces spectabilis]GGV57849.1 DNA-binding response regulator [Streptomyces spectabilis]